MHRNARLTFLARRTLVERIAGGRAVAHVAAELGVSRQTAHKWWRRWLEEGEGGLEDRPSRPRRSPARVPARLERAIERLRRREKLGPARIASASGCTPPPCIACCAAAASIASPGWTVPADS